MRERHAVADRFDLAFRVKRAHRLIVLASGVTQQKIAVFAQNAVDKRRIAGGKLADRAHAQTVQPVAGAFATYRSVFAGKVHTRCLKFRAKTVVPSGFL